jgi:hypothetical protein
MTTNASVTTHSWPVEAFVISHPQLEPVGSDHAITIDQLVEKIKNGDVTITRDKTVPANHPGVSHDVMMCQGRSILLVEAPRPTET